MNESGNIAAMYRVAGVKRTCDGMKAENSVQRKLYGKIKKKVI